MDNDEIIRQYVYYNGLWTGEEATFKLMLNEARADEREKIGMVLKELGVDWILKEEIERRIRAISVESNTRE